MVIANIPSYLRFYLFFFAALLSFTGFAQGIFKTYHVSVNGNDKNNGTAAKPFKTIMAAAKAAMPGDIVTVHAGVYRESINPPRGGTAANRRITYQAAKGEKVEIRGSEIIKGWKKNGVCWQVKISNSFFGAFNPYADTIHGDWLSKGSWCHTGEVYLNGKPLQETKHLNDLFSLNNPARNWYCRVDKDSTTICANFGTTEPDKAIVEINVRKSVFYPSATGINYITVRGFTMRHAATPWAPPTAEQVGLIGTHWSKGWIIENNTVAHSKCVGITLGKYGDAWDNKSESVEGFIKTIERALQNGWNKASIGHHLVQNNTITDCGQAAIVGSLGAVFSTITRNNIYDIGEQDLFWGYEKAGIKIHAAVDVEISRNHIYRTEGGIWLDWMAQGTHVTRNLLHDNRVQDFSLEVNHGPVLVDNNIFLSPQQAQVRLSQGVAFVHNLIAWQLWPTNNIDHRKTPFLQPHATAIAGLHSNPCGDTRYYNNLFLTQTDLSPYNEASLPVFISGNVYPAHTKTASCDANSFFINIDSIPARIVEEKNGWYLYINLQKSWTNERTRELVTSSLLGKAIIPNQQFETTDGKPFTVAADYLNKKRNTNPSPGPFEILSSGIQKMKVW